jgi:hypothetical protein
LVASVRVRDESNHFIAGGPISGIIVLSFADVCLDILIVALRVR